MTKASPEGVGCWVEGSWGVYTGARLIQIAAAYGWEDGEAVAAAERFMAGTPLLDEDGEDLEYEYLWDAVDEAEVYLNTYVAPEGFSFGWYDGEFFLWSDEDWEEVYGA